jgi:large subunit ribosomal protein L34
VDQGLRQKRPVREPITNSLLDHIELNCFAHDTAPPARSPSCPKRFLQTPRTPRRVEKEHRTAPIYLKIGPANGRLHIDLENPRNRRLAVATRSDSIFDPPNEASMHYPHKISRTKKIRKVGFRARMSTRKGRKIINSKRRLGRSLKTR